MPRFRRLLEALEDRRTPATFTVTDLSDSGPGTFRQAILDAEANPGPDDIDFQIGLIGTITLSSTLGTVTEPLNILGPGADKITVDADSKAGHLNLDDAADAAMSVAISGLTFARAKSASGASIRVSDASLTLTGVVLRDNVSLGGGGGALALGDGSKLTATGCTFSGNTALSGNGGAINMGYASTVLLQNCVVSGNRAGVGGSSYGNGGGISASYGTLTVINSVISGNVAERNTSQYGGGGVFVSSYASATLRGSTISGNTAFGHGGGVNAIYCQAITIENCTVSGNTALRDGGGLRVHYPYQAAEVSNTTVAFNASGGKGGGIAFFGDYYATLTLRAAVIASNAAKTAGPDLSGGLPADFTLLSNSLDAVLAGSNNLLDVDPRLGILASNGGPTPTHLPASPSPVRDAGPATSPLSTDQRGAGFPRLVGAAVDIGAVESAAGTPVAFPTTLAPVLAGGGTSVAVSVTFADDTGINLATLGTGDVRVTGPGGFDVLATFTGSTPGPHPGETVAGYTFAPPGGSWDAGDNGNYVVALEAGQVQDTAGNLVAAGTVGVQWVAVPQPIIVNATNDEAVDTDGLVSLREAVLQSNASPALETIHFDPVVFAGSVTITLSAGEIAATDALTIVGPGAAQLTVDANGASRHFKFDLVTAGGPVAVSGMTLTKGNQAGGFGGGSIFNEDADLTLSSMVLKDNKAGGIGGAIRMGGFAASKLLAVDCEFLDNTSEDDGGAIGIPPGGQTVVVRRSLFSGNKAVAVDSDGGAIALSGSFSSVLTIEDCTLINNSAAGVDIDHGGGALYSNGGQITVTGSTLTGNSATANGGGAIRVRLAGALTVVNSTISGNTAALDGGGIAQAPSGFGVVTITNSTVAFNTAGGSGGGFAGPNQFPVTTTITSTLIAKNGAPTAPDFFGSAEANASFVGDQTGAAFIGTPLSGDPLLGPLASNGGPTQTHALLPGSAAIDAGSNTLGLATDQRGAGFARVVGAAADVGAFEVQAGGTPAKISNVEINGGAAQRSRVTTLKVTFDQAVTLPANAADAFQLVRQSPAGSVNLAATASGSSVTLTFTGGAVDANSLADGRYTLTVLASQVNGGNFDGDGNGTAGDDFVLVGTPSNGLFRLFGDADGDGDVDAQDFGAFRGAFGTGSNVFDFDSDGDVDAADFGQFRARFGTSV